MDLKTNWNVFSKNRDAIYGVAIISIIIFHFFEDVASSNISGGRFAGEIYNTFVGSVGVEFFIFLSGVGLYFSMTKDSRVRYFFQKRLKRILPTYLTVAVPYWILFANKEDGQYLQQTFLLLHFLHMERELFGMSCLLGLRI